MRVEILGSGGAGVTPRPQCRCAICIRAREHGAPYARTGPSVFVHGPDVLIDTPEESVSQIDRLDPRRIQAALYSHFHPDHTQGRRMFDARNVDWRTWPPDRREQETTPIYVTEHVAADFRSYIGIWEHLEFMATFAQTVELHVVPDDEPIQLDDVTVTPIRLAEREVDAFLFEGDDRRMLIAMDELNNWRPPDLGRLDLVVLPFGIREVDPFTGERLIDAAHPVLAAEATYADTLEIVRALDAECVVLTHFEHDDAPSHDDLVRLGERDGWTPAYDGLVV
ncbi:MAG TPA: MBL fold metallo-hydrolase [Gaiellaceae bacterium]|nr:MBL fold metallo-hydrolase [Gaiellaceae bacterium]